MKTLKFVAFDIKNGILREWPRGFIIFFLFILSALTLFRLPSLTGDGSIVFSFGDYLVNVFAGMKEYVFDPRNPFEFPAFWMLLFLLIAYFCLRYPYQDLMGVGKHLMILSGNRIRWWVSKCVWVVINVLLFFTIGALALGLWTTITQGEFNLAVSQEIPKLLGFETALVHAPPWGIIGFIATIVTMTIALCLVQLLVTLYLKPVLSFFGMVTILFFSAYFKNEFLIGNYLMAARSEIFIQGGLSWPMGLLVSFVLIVAVTIFGGFALKHMDIFDRGRLA